jgi:hypothetical protein
MESARTSKGCALEVSLRWSSGDAACVLATACLHEGQSFTVGETDGCDVLIPFEALGTSRAEIVTWSPTPRVVPPLDASSTVDDEPRAPPPELCEGQVVRVSFGSFTLRAELVPLEDWEDAVEANLGLGILATVGLSAFVHLASFTLAFYLSFTAGNADGDVTAEQFLRMRALLDASAQSGTENRTTDLSRHAEQPGAASRSVVKDARAQPPAAAGSARPAEAWRGGDSPRSDRPLPPGSTGMAELIAGLEVAPGERSPFADTLASLPGREAAIHALHDDPSLEHFAIGGLALSGIGAGGGGNLGTGDDPPVSLEIPSLREALERELASGAPGSFGCIGAGCPGHVAGEHVSGARLRGAASPEAGPDEATIRRLVTRNWSRISACYQAGLRKNPALQGQVSLAFVVGPHGAVTVVRDNGSTLPDGMVRDCVVRVFYSFTFPPHPGPAMEIPYRFALTPPAASE